MSFYATAAARERPPPRKLGRTASLRSKCRNCSTSLGERHGDTARGAACVCVFLSAGAARTTEGFGFCLLNGSQGVRLVVAFSAEIPTLKYNILRCGCGALRSGNSTSSTRDSGSSRAPRSSSSRAPERRRRHGRGHSRRRDSPSPSSESPDSSDVGYSYAACAAAPLVAAAPIAGAAAAIFASLEAKYACAASEHTLCISPSRCHLYARAQMHTLQTSTLAHRNTNTDTH